MKFLQILFISVFSEQPNVVFVMLDDLGWGDVSWNNLKIKSTPFLESLARNGTILDQSYTTHRCSPRHWLKIIKKTPFYSYCNIHSHIGGESLRGPTAVKSIF